MPHITTTNEIRTYYCTSGAELTHGEITALLEYEGVVISYPYDDKTTRQITFRMTNYGWHSERKSDAIHNCISGAVKMKKLMLEASEKPEQGKTSKEDKKGYTEYEAWNIVRFGGMLVMLMSMSLYIVAVPMWGVVGGLMLVAVTCVFALAWRYIDRKQAVSKRVL